MDNQKLSQEQWDNLRSILLSKSKNPERLNQLPVLFVPESVQEYGFYPAELIENHDIPF